MRNNILICGGAGFIGSHYVRSIIKSNNNVINLDLLTYAASKKNLSEFEKNINYKFIKEDIGNKKKMDLIINKFKPNLIINFAAETHVDRSIDNAEKFIKTNINGVYNLLEILRKLKKITKNKIKFLQISTDEVYGDIAKDRMASEKDNYNPSSPYSASKASADQLVKAYGRTYGIKTLIANPCNNYGPNQFPEKFVPKMIFNILNNKTLPVYGKGKNMREWIYVKDNCEAILKIFLKGKYGENYNIGTGIKLRNIDIIKKIFKIAKKNKIKVGIENRIVFVKDRPGHDLRYALNSNKIRKKMKWKHKISAAKGLEKTFNWYKNNLGYFKKISKKNITARLGLKL